MTLGRADELYYTNEQLLIDLEEESEYITEETLIKFAKYLIFEGYMYTNNLYLAAICQKDPKKEFEDYQVSPSISIKVHYIYISQDELWAKYENIINKVKQKEKLTDSEALDIGAILGGMILKRITNTEKQNQLLGRINMRHIEKEIDKLVYDEYGDILDKKDKKIEKQANEIQTQANKIQTQANKITKLNNTNNEYKNKLKQLNNLNLTPEAKKIINSMLLL